MLRQEASKHWLSGSKAWIEQIAPGAMTPTKLAESSPSPSLEERAGVRRLYMIGTPSKQRPNCPQNRAGRKPQKLSVQRDVVRSADASSARILCRSQHADEASALLTDIAPEPILHFAIDSVAFQWP